MHAIVFNETNLPKILQTHGLSVKEAQGLSDVFITRDYVFIQGFHSDRVAYQAWAILPMFVFVKEFEFDHKKIFTEWDQIVPKS